MKRLRFVVYIFVIVGFAIFEAVNSHRVWHNAFLIVVTLAWSMGFCIESSLSGDITDISTISKSSVYVLPVVGDLGLKWFGFYLRHPDLGSLVVTIPFLSVLLGSSVYIALRLRRSLMSHN